MDLAKALGTSQAAITFWENGKRVPEVATMQRIAKFFGVPLSSLASHDEYNEDERITLIVDSMHKDPDLCLLFDAQRTMRKEDLQAVFAVVRAIKGERGDV